MSISFRVYIIIMKRYTKVECDVKDISSFILFIGANFFLAPFRLVGTLGKKVIFLPKEILNKLLIVAISLNFITLFITFIIEINADRSFSLLHGRVPLLIYFLSLLILMGIYLAFTLIKPDIIKVKEEVVPQKKQTDFTLYEEDDPLLKFMEQSSDVTEEEEYLEKLTKDNLKAALQDTESKDIITDKLNNIVKQDEFGLSEIEINMEEAINEQDMLQDKVLTVDLEVLSPEAAEAIYSADDFKLN